MSAISKQLVLLALLAGLAACKSQEDVSVYTPGPVQEPVVEEEAPPPMDEAQFQKQRMLADILYEAKKAYDDNRLMQPAGRNALDMYEQVLRLDPDNKVAVEGIREIALRYLAMADAAINQAALENAEGYLVRAARLGPELPELAASRARLAEARKNQLQVHPLNAAAIGARNAEAVKELATIARQLQASNGTFLIRARNDEEGRWIYKTMRDAVEGYRLRGNIDIAAAPAIVISAPAPDAKPANDSKPATRPPKKSAR